MKLKDTMIAWNLDCIRKPAQPWVRCGPHPVTDRDWTRPCLCTDGACWTFWRELTDAERLAQLFAMFGCLTAHDKVPAEVVHEAFREIDEYRAVVNRYRDDRIG
jgi:hypothetical protein